MIFYDNNIYPNMSCTAQLRGVISKIRAKYGLVNTGNTANPNAGICIYQEQQGVPSEQNFGDAPSPFYDEYLYIYVTC